MAFHCLSDSRSEARSRSRIASRSGNPAAPAGPPMPGLDLAFKKSRNASAKTSHSCSCASEISSSAFIKARRPLTYWTGPHIPHPIPPCGLEGGAIGPRIPQSRPRIPSPGPATGMASPHLADTRTPGCFWDAVRKVINDIGPGYVLSLQEKHSMAFPLGEHCDQNVSAGNLLAARRLDVNCSALQHPLEARCRLRVVAMCCDEVGKLVVDVVHNFAPQTVEVDATRTQHGNGVLILGERQQEMFECGVFVPALVSVGESPMQRLFEIARQHACLPSLANPFPACTAADADAAVQNP